jgi:Na+-transporting methylmalonyl-CoA/oxaloacetate decarboxylase gamma subunit
MMRNNTTSLFILLFLPLFSAIRLEADEVTEKASSATNVTPLSIVITGIVVVFVSLAIIAVIISLFRYFSKSGHKKREIQKKSIHERITSITRTPKQTSESVDQEVLSAIITTIFLYESEVEYQSKALLTMQRAKMSLWKQSAKLLMPNLVYWRRD